MSDACCAPDLAPPVPSAIRKAPDALWRLGAYYVPTILALWLGMVAIMTTYKLGRADHEENLRKLAASKDTAG